MYTYYWLCLDHIRAYNRSWDFFAGMSQRDIEAYQQSVATWHRPTWRMSLGAHAWRRTMDTVARFRDGGGGEGAGREVRRAIPAEERRALATLDLDPGVTLAGIKSRYKVLVKRHHPDANGGSRESEEQFKSINQAYTFLVGCGHY